MAEFYVEIYSNNHGYLYDRRSENTFFMDNYFFEKVNDSKILSLNLIQKYGLNIFTENQNQNVIYKTTRKSKYFVKLTDYYALPFLLMQKILESFSEQGCSFGRMHVNYLSW